MPRSSAPVIDAHCHVGSYCLAEDLLKMMDAAGVDRAVIFNHPWAWTLPRKDNYHNTNDYIADMQAKYPERLIGFACINPRYTGDPELGIPNLSVQELVRCVDELGLQGLKLHPENHCFPIDFLAGSEFMRTLSRLQKKKKRKIPILSHGMTTIGCMPDQFGTLAAAHPDVPIIIAHGAGFQNLYFPSYAPLKRHANLYADTAMTTIDDAHLRGVARSVGVEKIVFGSDHFSRDHGNLYGNFFYVLEHAFPDKKEREAILGGNLARIMGWK